MLHSTSSQSNSICTNIAHIDFCTRQILKFFMERMNIRTARKNLVKNSITSAIATKSTRLINKDKWVQPWGKKVKPRHFSTSEKEQKVKTFAKGTCMHATVKAGSFQELFYNPVTGGIFTLQICAAENSGFSSPRKTSLRQNDYCARRSRPNYSALALFRFRSGVTVHKVRQVLLFEKSLLKWNLIQ